MREISTAFSFSNHQSLEHRDHRFATSVRGSKMEKRSYSHKQRLHKLKLLVAAILVGCALGTMPAWPLWYRLSDSVQEAVGLLLLPGFMINLILNKGHIHDAGLVMTVICSCVVYVILSYLFLRLRQRIG